MAWVNTRAIFPAIDGEEVTPVLCDIKSKLLVQALEELALAYDVLFCRNDEEIPLSVQHTGQTLSGKERILIGPNGGATIEAVLQLREPHSEDTQPYLRLNIDEPIPTGVILESAKRRYVIMYEN